MVVSLALLAGGIVAHLLARRVTNVAGRFAVLAVGSVVLAFVVVSIPAGIAMSFWIGPVGFLKITAVALIAGTYEYGVPALAVAALWTILYLTFPRLSREV
ncbi:MAG: hypothetical protein ACT4O6_21560 [Reyranella sp.]